MNRLSLRNNRLKFKTAGKSPINLEEFIEYSLPQFNEGTTSGAPTGGCQHVKCWTCKHQDLNRLCPKISPITGPGSFVGKTHNFLGALRRLVSGPGFEKIGIATWNMLFNIVWYLMSLDDNILDHTLLMNKFTNMIMHDGRVHPLAKFLPSLVNNLWWKIVIDDWNLNEKSLGKWWQLQHYKPIIPQ